MFVSLFATTTSKLNSSIVFLNAKGMVIIHYSMIGSIDSSLGLFDSILATYRYMGNSIIYVIM